MSPAAQKAYAQMQRLGALSSAPREKSFFEYCKETVQNGKYNMKAIFALAWREVKTSKRSFAKALAYAWEKAKEKMKDFRQQQYTKNLDLSGWKLD